MKKLSIFAMAFAVMLFGSMGASALADGRGSGPVVYVTSQNLFYDSIVLTDVPQHGRFQQLVPGGPADLMTEFGPGDRGYVGGRWWLDLNGDGMMNAGDKFFLCPLLGPGRENP